MRLLRTIHTLSPTSGGPIEGIRQISPLLRTLGVQTTIATLDAEDAELPTDPSYEIVKLGPAKGLLGSSAKFRIWLENNIPKFDVAIVHGLWLYNGIGFWTANRKHQIPYLLYPHGMLDPWFKRAYPIKHIKKQLYWWLRERKLLVNAKNVLFTSQDEMLKSRGTFVPYQGITERVIKYGIAAPKVDREQSIYAFEKEHPETQNKECLLFLSRIHEKKGCDILIQAFAKLLNKSENAQSDLHLIIAGPAASSSYLDSLRELASNLEIADRITWTGMLQGIEKYGALHKATAFALPSHQENFGIAVAEALSCGNPIITTYEVNIWREIESDEAGIITEAKLPDFHQGLERFFSFSTEKKKQFRRNAAQCFRSRFHIQAAAEDLNSLLANISNKN